MLCALSGRSTISARFVSLCFKVHALSQTTMVFESAHTVNISQSTLNEVHGDYHYNISAPGERGMYSVAWPRPALLTYPFLQALLSYSRRLVPTPFMNPTPVIPHQNVILVPESTFSRRSLIGLTIATRKFSGCPGLQVLENRRLHRRLQRRAHRTPSWQLLSSFTMQGLAVIHHRVSLHP